MPRGECMEQQTNSIIGLNTSLKEIYALLDKIAPTNGTVLVTGESGTGKEVFVRTLHERSLRRDKPFVAINCGAIPEGLLESTLFGHEKGAFTNAHRSSPGRFEVADGGTVFLDEIGEMSLHLQVKLLRVLQEKEIERVGGTGPKKIDVRIVAATNKNLEEEVLAGRFREDLYYRLNVISVSLPPLRERKEDILPLCRHFLSIFCRENNKAIPTFSKDAEHALIHYPWNGNIRELENRMQYLSLVVDKAIIEYHDLPDKIKTIINAFSIPFLQESTNTCAQHTVHDKSEECIQTNTASDIYAAVQQYKAQNEQALLHKEEVQTIRTKIAPSIQNTHVSPSTSWPSLCTLKEHNMNLKEFLDTIENKLLQEALEKTEGIKNQAAEILGIKRTTLIEKLKKRGYGL